ncbi:MAG: hypothetical protein OQK98_03300 [Gammaproteobacteria bacterium]|nr:hypothetical protein [Gammaproteobacteria bacterium]
MPMDVRAAIEQLKLEWPEIYKAVIYQGIMLERELVLVHLNVAKIYDSLPEAVEEVAVGTPSN